ncbi:MAG TPA: S46 family peptidase, partial [Rhodothermales bacterium]|nr:S46 family peptidase [Rhodothermales bacterium]
EREVEGLYVEQLVAVRDVTREIVRDPVAGQTREQEAGARQARAEELEQRLTADAERREAGLRVQVVPLYSGARYSAYTFRRFDDVRLVMAPELQLGFFGGDPDNFTYPRYSLDYAFFRVYQNDQPYAAPNFFRFTNTGVTDGMPVFVVGNPGSTNRLATVAQLTFEREYTLPRNVDAIEARMAILGPYIEANPALADSADLRNAYFDLSNSQKSMSGGLAGLRDSYLMARKAAAERALAAGIDTSATLRARYGDVLRQLADLQRVKQASFSQQAAFAFFASPPFDSPILARAIYLTYLDALRRSGGSGGEAIGEVTGQIQEMPYWPDALERSFIRLRMEELARFLGADNIVLQRVLGGRTPEAFAADLVERTTLNDSTAVRRYLTNGFGGSGDVAVDVAQALFGLYLQTAQQQQNTAQAEESLQGALSQARFVLYGDRIPPDASFALRIADGRVMGYPYNGTRAPIYTTFYGLYDRHHSNAGSRDWALPERWRTPSPGFDLSTPLNLVTTADITGGNSGSPLLNRNLEVVGLMFDSNIEALPNDYLYRSERGRSVAVDVRAILETLDEMYDLDRLVTELTTGRLVRNENDADD